MPTIDARLARLIAIVILRIQHLAPLLLLLLGPRLSYGATISTFPLTQPTESVEWIRVGEISSTDPSGTATGSGHSTATLFGQSFVALPGLVSTLTVSIGGTGCGRLPCDGVDFKALLVELIDGKPLNVIAETGLFTVGPTLGTYGATPNSVAAPPLAPWQPWWAIDFGGVDLVDGATYAWILDFASPADGLSGSASVRGASKDGSSPNVQGHVVSAIFDLDTQALDTGWHDSEADDLMYALVFDDGGIASPLLDPIRQLPQFTSSAAVPEPTTLVLAAAAVALLRVTRSRR